MADRALVTQGSSKKKLGSILFDDDTRDGGFDFLQKL